MSAYPLDPPGTTYFNVDASTPFPSYPFSNSFLAPLISDSFHDWTLQASIPLTFSVLYYIIAHSANHFQSGQDRSKGKSIGARTLRFLIILHNAALCLYSLATFALMTPVVLDMFWQGYRAAGYEGVQVALCSMPTNFSLLGRWTYLFYLSKYYEVIDSVILHLKGKKIGNLQSYHHAGALICMWIAYRYQSQPVWVFCVFNSGVHTLMYAYYFCSALRLPFPRALKRNLTTLQIVQIVSGTVTTNLYFLQRLAPAKVHSLLVSSGTLSLLPPSIFASADETSGTRMKTTPFDFFSSLWRSSSNHHLVDSLQMQLSTYAKARSAYGTDQWSCLERRGSVLALHVNTMYMLPLCALFANFFIRSYLRTTPVDGRENGRREK